MLQKEAHLSKEVCEALKAVLIYQKISSPPHPLPEKQNKEKSGKMNYEETSLRNLLHFV